MAMPSRSQQTDSPERLNSAFLAGKRDAVVGADGARQTGSRKSCSKRGDGEAAFWGTKPRLRELPVRVQTV